MKGLRWADAAAVAPKSVCVAKFLAGPGFDEMKLFPLNLPGD